MPSLPKLSPAEIAALHQRPLGARAQIAQEYDAYLADFVAGDYGRAGLAAGERRAVVRQRLQAAARRRGLALRFRPGPGVALIFHVEAAPAEAPVKPPSDERHTRRRPDQPRAAARDRYQHLLPRWMRTGDAARTRPGWRRDDGKRRSR